MVVVVIVDFVFNVVIVIVVVDKAMVVLVVVNVDLLNGVVSVEVFMVVGKAELGLS